MVHLNVKILVDHLLKIIKVYKGDVKLLGKRV